MIGEQIQSLRRKRSWTQSELADKAGVTQTTVSRVESGKFDVSMRTVAKLLKALGATIKIA